MDDTEKKVMMEMHMKLTDHLDPLHIRGFLFHVGGISRQTAMSVSNEPVRNKRTEDFLFQIVEECPMNLFLDALNHQNMYNFLAKDLLDKLKEVENERTNGQNTDGSSFITATDDIPPIPNKVNVFTTHRNKAMKYRHMFKRLSHGGDYQKVCEMTQRMYTRWIKLKPDTAVGTKLADLVFMAYDSEVENRRVKYDCSLYKDVVFDNMRDIIPYTSEPKVSSMTFLARYGSAVTMKEPLDNGIAHLYFAREHSAGITPCYESGMVLYIEHNLLVQKYQLQPDSEIKGNLIKLAEDAIFHFGEEDESMRIDYKRMLLLKIAFIYLGIGLFGENMDVSIDEEDLKSAKDCLDCVERPDLWNGMETRRKMFFHIAKSKYYEQQKVSDLAVLNAKKAKKLAKIGQFNKELMNIERTIFELNATMQPSKEGAHQNEMETVMAEFLEEFPEDPDD